MTTSINWRSTVGKWRSDRARALRADARKVRGAYTAPGITEHTFRYADDLERAADLLDRDPDAPTED